LPKQREGGNEQSDQPYPIGREGVPAEAEDQTSRNEQNGRGWEEWNACGPSAHVVTSA